MFRIIRFTISANKGHPTLYWKDFIDGEYAKHIFKQLKERDNIVCAYLLFLDDDKVYEIDRFIKE